MTMFSCKNSLLIHVLLIASCPYRIDSFSFPSFSLQLPTNAKSKIETTTVFPPILGNNDNDELTFTPMGRIEDNNNKLLPLDEDEQESASSTKKKASAIVLNVNARQVSADELAPLARSIFGDDHVFVTTSEEEARKVATTALKDYSLVIPVGGDGTLASLLDMMVQQQAGDDGCTSSVEENMANLPVIGYVPMGTGNGLGSVVGASQPSGGLFQRKRRKLRQLEETFRKLKAVGDDIQKNRNDKYELVEIPMIRVSSSSSDDTTVNSSLCFFAGVGFDSLLLNDFKEQKAWSQRTGFFKQVLGSVTGYTVALLTRTLPRGKHSIHVEVSSSTPTSWIDHRRGDVVLPCGDNDNDNGLIYKGTTGVLCASTSPYYGGGLKMFPFARMHEDKMQLRLGRIKPLTGMMNLPSIFAGSFRDRSANNFGVLDFIGKDFQVKIDAQDGFPMQQSGESVGHVESVRFQVVDKTPVRFVSFWEPRVVEDE